LECVMLLAPYPAFHSSPRPEKQVGLLSVRGLPPVDSACQAPLAFVPPGCHFSQGRGKRGSNLF